MKVHTRNSHYSGTSYGEMYTKIAWSWQPLHYRNYQQRPKGRRREIASTLLALPNLGGTWSQREWEPLLSCFLQIPKACRVHPTLLSPSLETFWFTCKWQQAGESIFASGLPKPLYPAQEQWALLMTQLLRDHNLQSRRLRLIFYSIILPHKECSFSISSWLVGCFVTETVLCGLMTSLSTPSLLF